MKEIAISAVIRNWKKLSGYAPSRSWLPVEDNADSLSKKYLGCGSYGCVFPTNKDGVVFKITRDEREIDLVKFLIKNNVFLDGMVGYYGIVPLDEEVNDVTLHALWREEAYDLGVVTGRSRFADRLIMLKKIGIEIDYLSISFSISKADPASRSPRITNMARTTSSPEELMGVIPDEERLAVLLAMYDYEAKSMRNEIGKSLLELHGMGFVLCDIRIPNIGTVLRGGEPEYAIVDPGMSLYVK